MSRVMMGGVTGVSSTIMAGMSTDSSAFRDYYENILHTMFCHLSDAPLLPLC